ncbi:MAG: TRAP transporter substrate-binding protein [Romboutsia timonensis]|uniref:TRAP transporter substrate-binding protein n=1 Tax=Romboutsia timonensis TaxID=1776391 RepID=UPI002A760493|nr:TRAP transporter substrate-binding protein [Romboutsia timonensis]MDY3001535.1 TRAP transporter substrate-binding protein [Romboutsia timonensis]
MKIGKRITALMLIAAMSLVGVGCSSANGEGKSARVIRVAHGQNEEHPQHKALLEFEKYVEEKTNNELDVQIFPNELLGATSQAVELCQTGAIDLVVAGLGNLEAFEDSYTVLNLPYIMDSKEHYHEVMNDEAIMGPIYESTRESGFIGLTWFDAGVRNIYTTKKVINTPDDLKGLKIRVQTSPTNVKMLQALGASATPMSFGEVYTGLQQSVIDGAENNELALVNNKHGEVAKHYSYNMHAMLPDLLIVNARLLDELTKEQSQAIIDGAKIANEFEVEAWDAAATEAKEKAEEMGVQFYYPDIKPFQEKMKDLHNEYTQDANMKTIFDKIRAKGDEILARNENKENSKDSSEIKAN